MTALYMKKNIKNDFPIFSAEGGSASGGQAQAGKKPFVFLDSAAAAQVPQQVIDAIEEYYKSYKANVHSGIYAIGTKAVEAYENARVDVARFIGADSDEIIFTSGTTASINMLARCLEERIGAGDEIMVSRMEHHSNFIPWQELARRRNAVFGILPLEPDGTLSLDTARRHITERTKLVSITHVSHVTGAVNDVQEICRLAREAGAISVVDAAQSAPHMAVNVRTIGCDFLAFSGQKVLGPTGIGVLYGRRALLEELPPSVVGGGMVRDVRDEESVWASLPSKFEAGTPHAAGAIGLGAAVRYLEHTGGMDVLHEYEIRLANMARRALRDIPGITLYGPSEEDQTGSICSFTLRGIHPHDVAEVLSRENIAVRAGHHCALPLMRHLGISGTVRASFYLYNTGEDVERLIHGIKKVQEIFYSTNSKIKTQNHN